MQQHQLVVEIVFKLNLSFLKDGEQQDSDPVQPLI